MKDGLELVMLISDRHEAINHILPQGKPAEC
jgi:hypothetical protein